ncbi:hypothetical protein Bca101_014822 [Brassica carinata]
MYETFGWWRRADYLKVHFAESWSEMHPLLIMEVIKNQTFLPSPRVPCLCPQELGGNSWWFDRFLAQHIAAFYYFMTAFFFMFIHRDDHQRLLTDADHFSECVESHAFETYDNPNTRRPVIETMKQICKEESGRVVPEEAHCESIVDCIKRNITN